jgi:peptide/nickel transport system substrate-binding protein
MDRRDFLKATAGVAALAGSGGLAAPALAQPAGARTLRFVPQANLANFDPIWGTQYVVRNASVMVWDTLYGLDSKLQPQRQMVESEEVSSDGKTWTFKLREGLMWHDGTKVTAKDCAASLTRWCVRDGMGQMIRALQEELVAVDDRTFRWRLKAPYPKMLIALGKTNTPMAFMMPERLAKTDPFQQITEYVGSGPMRFARGEWVPGAKAVFTRFEQYRGRSEAPSWLAGNKTMNFDRIEWIIMPDPATASAALMNGEIDWWESPLTDLVPSLRRNRNIRVDIADPLGNIGSFRFNHLHAPFNDVRARRAVAMALSQEDYMRSVVGDDTSLWQASASFFTPGTPLYTEAGGDVLKGARNIEAARALLRESGYNGQPITVLVAQDQAPLKAMGEVTNALLRSIGMNVDFVATDWGTVGQRRASKSPPGQGGWHIFHTWHAGADCTNPATQIQIRANGDGAWFGWPKDDAVEAARNKWFDAPNLDAEKAAVAEMNRELWRHVTYIPTGFYKTFQAWRSNVSGVAGGPLPFFSGVTKA